MSENFKQLQEILEKQATVLDQLEELLQREKTCLSAFDREGLDRCNEQVQTLTLQLDILEQSRKEIHPKLAAQAGLRADEATLGRLAESLAGHESARLLDVRRRISETTDRIHALQQTNRVLIINGLRTIGGLRKIVEEAVNPQVTYNAGGIRQKSHALDVGRRI